MFVLSICFKQVRLLDQSARGAVKQLQFIQSAVAQVLSETRKDDHVSPVLRSLLWLPVIYKILLKIDLLVFRFRHRCSPS